VKNLPDEYEVGVRPIIEKIKSLYQKINTITFTTVFKQNANNYSVLLLDIITTYGRANTGHADDFVNKFMVIDRSLYVDVMSAFEYEIRQFIQKQSNANLNDIKESLNQNPFLSISKILESLLENEYFNQDSYDTLVGLFSIRNMIVHHHSLVSQARESVPDEIKNMFADFTLGKRLYGKPEMFLNLIEMLVDIYLEWYKDKPVLQEIYSEDQSRNH